MNHFKSGWFSEIGAMNDTIINSLQVDTIVYEETTPFQELKILDTPGMGRILTLDNAIQCTEKDQFSYQEMMAFLPLCCHPNPQSVLIVGGGDGGVAREVVKHPSVQRVVLCEIDPSVLAASRKYLPFMSMSMDHPKLTILTEDGLKYAQSCQNTFDVIITDSSDPIGPAQVLFEEPYYRSLFQALKPGGVICSQAENIWFQMDTVTSLVHTCGKHYKSVGYATILIPSYPSGMIGALVCCKDEVRDLAIPMSTLGHEVLSSLKYYTPEIHAASFVIPKFAKDILYPK